MLGQNSLHNGTEKCTEELFWINLLNMFRGAISTSCFRFHSKCVFFLDTTQCVNTIKDELRLQDGFTLIFSFIYWIVTTVRQKINSIDKIIIMHLITHSYSACAVAVLLFWLLLIETSNKWRCLIHLLWIYIHVSIFHKLYIFNNIWYSLKWFMTWGQVFLGGG